MEKITEFWDSIPGWAKLIGSAILVICTLVSVSNASLNLKDRFKNWWAIRSKKGIEKRLGQLWGHVAQLASYQKNPMTFFVIAILNISKAIMSLSLSVLMIVIGSGLVFFVFGYSSTLSKVFIGLFGLFVALWLWISTTAATDLLIIIRYYRFPRILVDEITELVNKGRKKGYIADNEKEVLDFLKEINIAPNYDFSTFEELVNKP